MIKFKIKMTFYIPGPRFGPSSRVSHPVCSEATQSSPLKTFLGHELFFLSFVGLRISIADPQRLAWCCWKWPEKQKMSRWEQGRPAGQTPEQRSNRSAVVRGLRVGEEQEKCAIITPARVSVKARLVFLPAGVIHDRKQQRITGSYWRKSLLDDWIPEQRKKMLTCSFFRYKKLCFSASFELQAGLDTLTYGERRAKT